MGLSLSDVRAGVVRNLGGTMTDEYDVNLSNVVLTSIINECLHVIATERDWPWLEATESIPTVAGTQAYTPASDWYRTKELFLVGEWDLTALSAGELDARWPTPERGVPTLYAVRDGKILIAPIPDSVYTLRHTYYRSEPDLVDDSDEPLLPNQFRGRLIDMATAEAASRLRLWAVQQRYQTKDAAWERRMRDDKMRTLAPKRVRVRDNGRQWGF